MSNSYTLSNQNLIWQQVYCLAMLMVEAGQAKLIATAPGEAGLVCTFRTVAGDVFNLNRPPLSAEDEAAMKATLREILEEEGGL